MIQNRTIESYHFGLSLHLSEPQLRSLTSLFQNSAPSETAVLGGRNSACEVELDDIGPLVIKHYRRGGLMRHFNERRYFRWGKSRSQREFEFMLLAQTAGVNVPRPVAYAYRGRLIYQTWLVTRAIRQAVTLARLSLRDESSAVSALHSVVEQISSLIHNNLLHVDLHPGNVVVDGTGKVYLLDFDRGRVYRGNRQTLKNRYIIRWQRAVDKHGLPKSLSEKMRDGLK